MLYIENLGKRAAALRLIKLAENAPTTGEQKSAPAQSSQPTPPANKAPNQPTEQDIDRLIELLRSVQSDQTEPTAGEKFYRFIEQNFPGLLIGFLAGPMLFGGETTAERVSSGVLGAIIGALASAALQRDSVRYRVDSLLSNVGLPTTGEIAAFFGGSQPPQQQQAQAPAGSEGQKGRTLADYAAMAWQPTGAVVGGITGFAGREGYERWLYRRAGEMIRSISALRTNYETLQENIKSLLREKQHALDYAYGQFQQSVQNSVSEDVASLQRIRGSLDQVINFKTTTNANLLDELSKVLGKHIEDLQKSINTLESSVFKGRTESNRRSIISNAQKLITELQGINESIATIKGQIATIQSLEHEVAQLNQILQAASPNYISLKNQAGLTALSSIEDLRGDLILKIEELNKSVRTAIERLMIRLKSGLLPVEEVAEKIASSLQSAIDEFKAAVGGANLQNATELQNAADDILNKLTAIRNKWIGELRNVKNMGDVLSQVASDIDAFKKPKISEIDPVPMAQAGIDKLFAEAVENGMDPDRFATTIPNKLGSLKNRIDVESRRRMTLYHLARDIEAFNRQVDDIVSPERAEAVRLNLKNVKARSDRVRQALEAEESIISSQHKPFLEKKPRTFFKSPARARVGATIAGLLAGIAFEYLFRQAQAAAAEAPKDVSTAVEVPEAKTTPESATPPAQTTTSPTGGNSTQNSPITQGASKRPI